MDFGPNRSHIGTENHTAGIDYQIERSVSDLWHGSHVGINRFDRQPFALGDFNVALQLFFAQVGHGHIRTERGENGGLLPTAGGQAQHFFARDGENPIVRHRYGRRHAYPPRPRFGQLDLFRGHCVVEIVTLISDVIPSLAIVFGDVNIAVRHIDYEENRTREETRGRSVVFDRTLFYSKPLQIACGAVAQLVRAGDLSE